MKKYFLVARYKNTNQFSIIKLNDKWFLGKDGVSQDYRANDLAAVDLVTTRFFSETQMIDRMYQNGYISSTDVDLFIATGKKHNGKPYVQTYEILYGASDDEFMRSFRGVADSFLRGKGESSLDSIKNIYNEFCMRMYQQRSFFSFVSQGGTNVAKRIVDYFSSFCNWQNPAFSFKFKESWVLKSYTAIRNIMESFQRYDMASGDVFQELPNIKYKTQERNKISASLLSEMDPSYMEGQMNLFDLSFPEVKDTTPKRIEPEIISDSGEKVFSPEEKKSQVMLTLSDLSMNTFCFDDNKKAMISPKLFPFYPSIKDQEIIEHSLCPRDLSCMYWYTLHNTSYSEACRCLANTLELEEELRKDVRRITSLLQKPKSLDRIFVWCRTYRQVQDYNTERGKVYGKRMSEVCS